jgi:sulfite reductase (NADPH) flavoprotein alpha-component
MNATLATALSSPLTEERADLLLRLTDGLDPAALQWLSGYTAGLAVQLVPTKGILQAVPLAEVQNNARLSIVYGSQTGNARREAEALQQEAQAHGLSVRLVRADAYPLKELTSERLLYVVISTQGEGDPPDDSIAFVEYLSGRRAPKLNDLSFAVLGLGDSSYPQFNAVANKIDARLAELGGKRVASVANADIDVETIATPWRAQAITYAQEALKTNKPSAHITALRPAIVSTFSKDRPFAAELLGNQRITGRHSDQDIRHLEISLGEQLSYQPGDALGIWPRNDEKQVNSILSAISQSADTAVTLGEKNYSLHEWLSSKREITRLNKNFLQQHAKRSNASALKDLLSTDDTQAISSFINQNYVGDLLRQYPAPWDAQELVQVLRPITPRLYSIASSQKAVGNEAHLTVAIATFEHQQTQALGVASGYLAAYQEGEFLSVFIEPNERFRLPQDNSRDILMIGPGTGVAPFRGFVQERIETQASGKNWLLFGARNAESQFLYQLEWQEALKQGQLHRLDLAFSRDQAERIYVQQRLRENGADVYAWLESGAHVYICGAIAMGKDVQQTLVEIVSHHGAKSLEDAQDYISILQQSGRLAKDVY